MSQWDQTKAAAQKALGKTGKLPKERTNIAGEVAKYNKVYAAFNTSREDLEKKLVALQDGSDSIKHALQQYLDVVQSDSFGLDPKKDDDKQKIAQVSKILCDYLTEKVQASDNFTKELGTLDRGLTDVSRLKDVTI